jgi:hypothetical protein
VSVDPDALRSLTTAERARLERFAAVFERLDAKRYATLTEGYDTAEVAAAKAAAQELVGGSRRRRDAVRAAVRTFTDAATVAYADRMSLPDTLLLFQSLPDRAPDRMRFLESVERVVVALILWDELDEGDREVLVGPWATLVEPVVEG